MQSQSTKTQISLCAKRTIKHIGNNSTASRSNCPIDACSEFFMDNPSLLKKFVDVMTNNAKHEVPQNSSNEQWNLIGTEKELSYIQQFMDSIICCFESGSPLQIKKSFELLIHMTQSFQLKDKSFPFKGFAHFASEEFDANLRELKLTFDDYLHMMILTINKRIFIESVSETDTLQHRHILETLLNCLFDDRLKWEVHSLFLDPNQKTKQFGEILEKIFPWSEMLETGIQTILEAESARLEKTLDSKILHSGLTTNGPFISLAFSFLGADSKIGQNAVEAFWAIAQRMISQKGLKSAVDDSSIATFTEFLGLLISKCRLLMPDAVFQNRFRECMEFFQKLREIMNFKFKTQFWTRFLSRSRINTEENYKKNPKDKAFFKAIDEEFGFLWERREIQIYEFDADVEMDFEIEDDFEMGSNEQ